MTPPLRDYTEANYIPEIPIHDHVTTTSRTTGTRAGKEDVANAPATAAPLDFLPGKYRLRMETILPFDAQIPLKADFWRREDINTAILTRKAIEDVKNHTG
eukprot:g45878.t1